MQEVLWIKGALKLQEISVCVHKKLIWFRLRGYLIRRQQVASILGLRRVVTMHDVPVEKG